MNKIVSILDFKVQGFEFSKVSNVALVRHSLANWKALVALMAVAVVSGCSTTPEKDIYNEFYDGQASAVYLQTDPPETIEEATYRGDMALKERDSDRALFEYIRGLALDDNNEGLLYKVGSIHASRGNHELAQTAYEQVIDINAEHVGALEGMGLVLLEVREYEQSEVYFKRSIRADQSRIEHKLMGTDLNADPKLKKEKKYKRVRDEQDVAMSKNQNTVKTVAPEYRNKPIQYNGPQVKVDKNSPYRAYNSMGVISDLKKDYVEGLLYYKVALKIKPRSAVVWNNMGYSRYLAGDWKAAEKSFKRAIGYKENYNQAWKNLGLLYTRQERYPEALSTFGRLMEKYQAYNDIGYLCMLEGKHEQAAEFFSKALQLSPSYYEMAKENLERNRSLREIDSDYRAGNEVRNIQGGHDTNS